jgi:MFS family permease
LKLSLELESDASAAPGRGRSTGSAHLAQAISSHALLRIASGANGILIGLYLAHLDNAGAAHSVQMVGTLSAVSFAAELLASLPMGVASDALHPRWLMTGGALAGAVAAVLFAVSDRSSIFFFSRFLEGIGAAAVVPALLAYLTVNTQGDRTMRARVMSYFELSLLGGLAFGGLLASELFHQFHAGSFVAIACVYLLCAVLLFFATRTGAQAHTDSPLAALKSAWKLPALRHLAPVWLCVNCIVGLWLGSTLPFLLTRARSTNQFLDGVFAGQPSRVGLMLLGYSVVFGLGVTLWSFILPRLSLRVAMRITLAAMLPVCVGFYLFNHTAPGSGSVRWALGIATAAAIMVESGFTPAALAWLAGTLPPQSGRGAAMGIYSVLLSLGAILGSLLAGVLGNRFAIDGLLYGTAGVAVLALFFLHWVPAQTHPGGAA